jgi:hypothetical protein
MAMFKWLQHPTTHQVDQCKLNDGRVRGFWHENFNGRGRDLQWPCHHCLPSHKNHGDLQVRQAACLRGQQN